MNTEQQVLAAPAMMSPTLAYAMHTHCNVWNGPKMFRSANCDDSQTIQAMKMWLYGSKDKAGKTTTKISEREEKNK